MHNRISLRLLDSNNYFLCSSNLLKKLQVHNTDFQKSKRISDQYKMTNFPTTNPKKQGIKAQIGPEKDDLTTIEDHEIMSALGIIKNQNLSRSDIGTKIMTQDSEVCSMFYNYLLFL